MEIVLLIIIAAAFIWSTYKLLDGFSHIRKYSIGRFMLHAILVTVSGGTLLVYMVLYMLGRL
ncbi:hypothetical protein BEYONPHE_6 [Bacillus phage Beyonphe]|nr:hypothetical protein BEYONPHE_6 [Bacillus phage Beyonphe]